MIDECMVWGVWWALCSTRCSARRDRIFLAISDRNSVNLHKVGFYVS